MAGFQMTSPWLGDRDDSDADGLHWELTPQQSDGFGRAIGAALDRDLAVGAIAGRAEPEPTHR
jgi:hypothetical protein